MGGRSLHATIITMNYNISRKSVQFWLAVAVCVFGCVLLVISLILRPTGEIDTSVLTAFGEIETVALALFGIEKLPIHDTSS